MARSQRHPPGYHQRRSWLQHHWPSWIKICSSWRCHRVWRHRWPGRDLLHCCGCARWTEARWKRHIVASWREERDQVPGNRAATPRAAATVLGASGPGTRNSEPTGISAVYDRGTLRGVPAISYGLCCQGRRCDDFDGLVIRYECLCTMTRSVEPWLEMRRESCPARKERIS